MKKIILSISVFSATFLLLVSFQNCGKGFDVSSGADFNVDESSLQYFEKNGFVVYGDQIFKEDSNSVSTNKNKATGFGSYNSRMWPENKIYFDFESLNTPKEIRGALLRACSEWSVGANFSCEIANADRIVSRESVLLISTSKAGCWSTLGYYGPNRQVLNLGVGCNYYGTILHELGHSIGFIHEHQRADRDNYIELIEPEKLYPEWRDAIFVKFSEADLNYFNKPYDIDSIMHYSNYDGRKKIDGGKTFDVITNRSQIVTEPFDKLTLSISDRTAVKELYGNSQSPQRVQSQIIMSLSFDGPAQTTFYVNQTVYGRVTGFSQNAKSCTEHDNNIGKCNNLSNFTMMPNADWKYYPEEQTWRAQFVILDYYKNLHFKSFWYDLDYNIYSPEVRFEVLDQIRSPSSGTSSNGQVNRSVDINASAESKAKAAAEAQAKAAAELQAKKNAEAKAAAETRARVAAEAQANKIAQAKAAAEVQAKKNAEAKAAADARARIAAEAQAKRVAESKAAAAEQAKKIADARAKAAVSALKKQAK